MNIVHVNTSDVGQGAENCTVTLHRRLLDMGHRSTLLVGRKRSDTPSTIQIPYRRGVPGSRRIARRLEKSFGWQDIYNPSFRALSDVIPPDADIIHFNNLWGAQGYADIGALPSISRNKPAVLTEHQNWFFTGHCSCSFDCGRWRSGCGSCPRLDMPPAIPKDGSAFNWRRKKRMVQKSNITFVGVSDHICRLAEQSPIWADKKIRRIYNGIDTELFSPCLDDVKHRLKQELGIPEEGTAVLVTGQTLNGYLRGRSTEGYEALNRLQDFRLIPVLVGQRTEKAAQNLNVGCVRIPYRETAEEMADVYRACDITLVTSAAEAFGRIPAESQSCGTPVVSVNVGSLPEVVAHNTGGLVCKAGHAEELAEALTLLARSDDRREQLGANGRRYVQDRFAVDLIAQQHLDLYHEILGDELK